MPAKYDRGESDPYVSPGTEVLKNLSGIRDAHKAQQKETADALHRNAELNERPIAGNFDLAHLKAIHRHLFQDSYAWAGETRTIDIAKGNTRFGSHLHIESYGQRLFAGLSKERAEWKANPGKADLPDRLAYYMGEINAMHPFREGNGRTQRVFTKAACGGARPES